MLKDSEQKAYISLLNQLKISGPISVSSFIKSALLDPVHGYYQHHNPLPSSNSDHGDFITSPEISQVFGELIVAYLASIAAVSKTPRIALVEAGAGTGVMMRDMLASLLKLKANPHAGDFMARVDVNIIEASQHLAEIQQQNLAGFGVRWHEDFGLFLAGYWIAASPSVPRNDEREIYFIANELFDCFGVNQYLKTPHGWQEIMVGAATDKDELEFKLAPFDLATNQEVEKLIPQKDRAQISEGAIFEHSPDSIFFMTQLADAIAKHGGIAIIIDYGYSENPYKSTIQALAKHKKCDVLQNAFAADITNLVNFSPLKEIAEQSGLNSSLITQREFLLATGIEERRKTLKADKSPTEQKRIDAAIDRLINDMGELFKFLIIWK